MGATLGRAIKSAKVCTNTLKIILLIAQNVC